MFRVGISFNSNGRRRKTVYFTNGDFFGYGVLMRGHALENVYEQVFDEMYIFDYNITRSLKTNNLLKYD